MKAFLQRSQIGFSFRHASDQDAESGIVRRIEEMDTASVCLTLEWLMKIG